MCQNIAVLVHQILQDIVHKVGQMVVLGDLPFDNSYLAYRLHESRLKLICWNCFWCSPFNVFLSNTNNVDLPQPNVHFSWGLQNLLETKVFFFFIWIFNVENINQSIKFFFYFSFQWTRITKILIIIGLYLRFWKILSKIQDLGGIFICKQTRKKTVFMVMHFIPVMGIHISWKHSSSAGARFNVAICFTSIFFSRILIIVQAQGDLLTHKFGVITFNESQVPNCLAFNKLFHRFCNAPCLQVTFLKSPKDSNLLLQISFRLDKDI